MYHYVRPQSEKNGNLHYLTLDKFKKQLDLFEREHGFISIDEFRFNFQNKIKSNKILLTFDDGLLDHYKYVFPILNEREIKGVFFIPTSILSNTKILNVHKIHNLLAYCNSREIFNKSIDLLKKHNIYEENKIDDEIYSYSNHEKYELKIKQLFNYKLDYHNSNMLTDLLMKHFKLNNNLFNKIYLNESQLKIMSKKGQIIGSHTSNHRILSSMNYKSQFRDIKESFSFLKNYLNNDFKAISYPFGYSSTYNEDTFNVLEKLKVEFGFVFDNLKSNNFNKLKISRIDCNNFIS